MTNDELLKCISAKMDAILLVLLSEDIKTKSNVEKVALLARLGLANQDIANILGTSKGTVEVWKSRANKKGK